MTPGILAGVNEVRRYHSVGKAGERRGEETAFYWEKNQEYHFGYPRCRALRSSTPKGGLGNLTFFLLLGSAPFRK